MRFGVGLFSLQCTAMQPRHWTGAYRDMRELASLMEELGYDELWLSEHHFFYDGYCPALLPAAASVLSVTQRLRVGTGMLLLPMYDPARLAEVATDLAERSGGRLDLGVGTLTQVWEEGWAESGRPPAEKPALGALRNIWLTEDKKEREAARDWVRASYVQYAGLGWTLPAVGDHQQQDYAEETDKAIADTVETTITGSADECIRQLQQFDEIGIKHIAFRLILDGEPRLALESQLRRLSDLVLPRLRDKVPA